jgi:hypothetical protein
MHAVSVPTPELNLTTAWAARQISPSMSVTSTWYSMGPESHVFYSLLSSNCPGTEPPSVNHLG